MEVELKGKLKEDGTLVLSAPENVYSETGRIFLKEEGTKYGTMYFMDEQEIEVEKPQES